MRGEIIEFDAVSGTGVISGDDGQRYGFDHIDLATPATLRISLRVDFSPTGDRASQILLIEAPASPWADTDRSPAAHPPENARLAGPTDIDWRQLLFSFNGRIGRTHYWIGWAATFGVGLVLGFIPILNLLGLLLLWPTFAIAVKRFHDMGKTGWLIAIPYVIQIVAFFYIVISVGVAAFSDPDALDEMQPEQALALLGPGFGVMFLALIVSLGFWLWMGIADGQRGRNKYGLDPKNPIETDVFN